MFSRRGFLAGLGALIGGVALEQAIPFGRVWSFPKNIVARPNTLLTISEISAESLRILEKHIKFTKHFVYDEVFARQHTIGSVLKIRKPARYFSDRLAMSDSALANSLDDFNADYAFVSGDSWPN